MRRQPTEHPIVAAIAAFLTLAPAGGCSEEPSQTQQMSSQVRATTSKRAAHFDSDRLMNMLREAGIHAEFGGDLMLRPDALGL